MKTLIESSFVLCDNQKHYEELKQIIVSIKQLMVIEKQKLFYQSVQSMHKRVFETEVGQEQVRYQNVTYRSPKCWQVGIPHVTD